MAPPQRRGGGGGGGGSEGRGGGAGKSTSRGGGGSGSRGGGRGPRGGGGGANAEAAPAQDTASSVAEGGGARTAAKPKPQRKPKGSDAPRNGGGGSGGGAPVGRPARAVSIVTRKVLVRNIPHDWDEDKLIELIEPHGVTREHVWRFVAGKARANNRAPRPGRLYMDFKRDAALAKSVIEKLHGFAIPDRKDEPALDVEFAPFQKIPREKQRKDAKVGTIDRDPDFVAFLEALAKPKEKLPSADIAAELKDTDGVAEKPVAALVQFLNERKRDKKGKFAGKATEKARGARVKSAKEGKGAKDKSKSTKGGKGKTAEPLTTKETTKPRKSRGKLSKEKTVEPEQVEPGAIKIMGVKTRDSSSTRSETKPAVGPDATPSDTTGGPPPKSKSAGGKNGGGKARTRSAQATGPKEPKEPTTEAAAPGEASAGPKDSGGPKPSGRARRDSRHGKGSKGGGRGGDQPKKVFAPKVTTPAG